MDFTGRGLRPPAPPFTTGALGLGVIFICFICWRRAADVPLGADARGENETDDCLPICCFIWAILPAMLCTAAGRFAGAFERMAGALGFVPSR